jgi:hypothetical protein
MREFSRRQSGVFLERETAKGAIVEFVPRDETGAPISCRM